MTNKKKGLGRGISSLLGETNLDLDNNQKNNNIVRIPIDQIRPGPWQARLKFSEKNLAELVESIKIQGVISPIILTPSKQNNIEDHFYLVAGERRWRACQLAKIHEIPAIILQNITGNQAAEISLVENIQRQDLNPIEEAKGYEYLVNKYKYTQEKISKMVGKSRAFITNSIRLLRLPEKILEMIINKELSVGHARVLIGNDQALETAKEILKKQLSVRETEKLIKNDGNKVNKEKEKNIEMLQLENDVSTSIGLKVKIDHNTKRKKTKLTIYCSNNDQLNNIIDLLIK